MACGRETESSSTRVGVRSSCRTCRESASSRQSSGTEDRSSSSVVARKSAPSRDAGPPSRDISKAARIRNIGRWWRSVKRPGSRESGSAPPGTRSSHGTGRPYTSSIRSCSMPRADACTSTGKMWNIGGFAPRSWIASRPSHASPTWSPPSSGRSREPGWSSGAGGSRRDVNDPIHFALEQRHLVGVEGRRIDGKEEDSVVHSDSIPNLLHEAQDRQEIVVCHQVFDGVQEHHALLAGEKLFRG